MRIAAGIIGSILGVCLTALTQAREVTITIPDDDVNAPRMTLDTPNVLPPQSPNAPVLFDITWRKNVSNGRGLTFDVVPDFHFSAPNGNAIIVHRELIDTSGPIGQTQLRDATINIPAAAQKKGAVQSGGWRCGAQQYYITIRAFIMDADGNRSNPMEYTIHCNGG